MSTLAIISCAIYIAGMTTDASPFEGFACFSVYAAGLAFNRLYKHLLERFGLTYPQYLVVVALRRRDGQTVGELGESLFLESNTLTPLLKRMESTGLVARRRDEADERVVRISLTGTGRNLAEEIDCLPPEVLAASGLTPEQLGAVAGTLDRLAENLRRHVRA